MVTQSHASRLASAVDVINEPPERRFNRAFDPASARRQLRVSILLVTAVGLAAFTLGFALPLHAPHATKLSPLSDHSGFKGRLVTINDH
jgi:hypothetical protein